MTGDGAEGTAKKAGIKKLAAMFLPVGIAGGFVAALMNGYSGATAIGISIAMGVAFAAVILVAFNTWRRI